LQRFHSLGFLAFTVSPTSFELHPERKKRISHGHKIFCLSRCLLFLQQNAKKCLRLCVRLRECVCVCLVVHYCCRYCILNCWFIGREQDPHTGTHTHTHTAETATSLTSCTLLHAHTLTHIHTHIYTHTHTHA